MTRGRAAGLRGAYGPDFVASQGSTMPPAGVETQARQMQPAPPVINTMASDRVATAGRAAPAMMQPMQAPMMQPAPRSANPLGGMDARPLSARGGPMGYAPRGVGTNNPNAYAVGMNNKGFAERTGQMPMMQQAPPSMMMGAGGYSSPTMTAPAPAGMAPMGMAPMATGRDDPFWAQMSADTSGFMAGQDKLGADMQAADDQAAAKIEDRAQNTAQDIMKEMRQTARARETYSLPDAVTGEISNTHQMTGNGQMMPRNQMEPRPMTAEEIAAILAAGGSVKQKLGNADVSYDAPREPSYTPVPAQQAMIQGQESTPDRVFDRRTGKYYAAGQAPQAGQAGQSANSGYNPFK